MPSTRARVRTFPVEKISNEILLVILRNLDPPSAVCFALTNKQLYTFVASFCKRGIEDVCPRTMKKFRRAPVLLRKYEPSKTETKFYFSMRGPWEHRFYHAPQYDASRRLSKQYISLMLRLHRSSFLDPQAPMCLQAGHLKTVLDGSTTCIICADLAKFQSPVWRGGHDPEKLRSLSKTLHEQSGWSQEDVAKWDRSFFEPTLLEDGA